MYHLLELNSQNFGTGMAIILCCEMAFLAAAQLFSILVTKILEISERDRVCLMQG